MSAASLEELSKDELIQKALQLHTELEQLKRMIFGSKSERFVPVTPAEQLPLPLNIESENSATVTPEVIKVEYTREKTTSSVKVKTARMKLPAHLPRVEIVIEPEVNTEGLKKIGEEITEELEYEPGRFFVNKIVRPKYILPSTDTTESKIVIGELPSRPIEKGIPGVGLLANICVDKYVYHLPLYRQNQKFKNAGIVFPESTLSGWMPHIYKQIEPLGILHRKIVLEQSYLMVDETPIKVLDKDKKGSTHRGFYWVYYSPEKEMVLFDYRPGRGREGPTECLDSFMGYLQTDGYNVYEMFDSYKEIKQLNCFAHARRMFERALENDAMLAQKVMLRIQKLYEVERIAREAGLSNQERYELRQKESLPILRDLYQFMKDAYSGTTPSSVMGKALHYSLSRWEKLTRYTENGMLEIDSNFVENSIRPVAIGRKNYLFCGSHQAAERAAMFYSFFASCKRMEIDPYTWLKDVLSRIQDHSINKLEELLPYNWKKA